MAASVLRPHAQKIRVPTSGDKIYKEECVFCFDTPESPTGLYVCMNTFLGFSRKHVEQHFARTSNAVYLHIKRNKIPIKKDPAVTEVKPTKLAIGLEGGFDVNQKKYEYDEHYTVVLLPDFYEIPLPCPDLPESVQLCIATILASDAASKVEDAKALDGTWDGMQRRVTKHADTLIQLDNGVKIPPQGWKCEVCGLTENLWLNLTDGAVHCGRRYFDGTGGNNHAMEHYTETKYPLVVKLGTITPEGGDVYSYDEDNMVIDPNLPTHLAHFGININQLQKTEKSMIELEIDLNQRVGEWAIIQESGSSLQPLYGPGYTGLANLGNSCYLNSVVQVLFSIPDFQKKYFSKSMEIFAASPVDPTSDFNVQMAKLAHGLLSGEYSKAPEGKDCGEEQDGIRPHMFKCLVGQGHPEFSTKRQQDAQEFFLHLITIIERHSRDQENPADALKLQVEEKIQCVKSRKVKYNNSADYFLSLSIPLDAAINKDEVVAYELRKAEKVAKGDKIDEIVRPRIPLQACIENFASTEIVHDFYSTALNAKTTASKTFRIRTFPDYLMLQLKKFTIGDDWVPKKLDVAIDVPDVLDLQSLRGHGLQPDEEELPEPATAAKEFEYNEGMMSHLTEMGYPLEACKRALYYTKNHVDQAITWLDQHISDADYNSPFNPDTSAQKSDFVPNAEAVAMIESMGFSTAQASKALQATDNQVDRAVDWIFSHSDELDDTCSMDCTENVAKFRDGPEKYELVAFISHMGTSIVVGHYVCHIKKDGQWVIFNDNKVALSENPPKEFAYMYLYRRTAASVI